MQLKTVQPSKFENRIFFREKLTPGLKLRTLDSQETYVIRSIDKEESTKDYTCYVLNIPVWSIKTLHLGTEFEVCGYRPEYQLELKETLKVEEHLVDLYLENLKENKKIEKEYRAFKKSDNFNLSGFYAADRKYL